LAVIQLALQSISSSRQSKGTSFADKGTKNDDCSYSPRSDQSVIKEKISYSGFKVSIRLASNTKKTLTELVSAFCIFTRSDGNSFALKKINH